MPLCSKCGYEVSDDAEFCRQCGEALAHSEASRETAVRSNAPALLLVLVAVACFVGAYLFATGWRSPRDAHPSRSSLSRGNATYHSDTVHIEVPFGGRQGAELLSLKKEVDSPEWLAIEFLRRLARRRWPDALELMGLPSPSRVTRRCLDRGDNVLATVSLARDENGQVDSINMMDGILQCGLHRGAVAYVVDAKVDYREANHCEVILQIDLCLDPKRFVKRESDDPYFAYPIESARQLVQNLRDHPRVPELRVYRSLTQTLSLARIQHTWRVQAPPVTAELIDGRSEVLASLAFAISDSPISRRMMEKAETVSCLSNVKQQMTGILMYCQDFDEKFPLTHSQPNTTWTAPNGRETSGDMPWMIVIDPYLKNTQIFNCPSVSSAWDGGAATTCVSYGYNENLSGIVQARCNFSAELCAIADGGTDGNHSILKAYGPDNGRDSIALERHISGCNVGFADGHAKWLNGSNIPQDRYDGFDPDTMVRFWDPTSE